MILTRLVPEHEVLFFVDVIEDSDNFVVISFSLSNCVVVCILGHIFVVLIIYKEGTSYISLFLGDMIYNLFLC